MLGNGSKPEEIVASSSTNHRHGRLWTYSQFALATVASFGLTLAIFSAPVVLTLDGPQHIYLVHILNHFSDPGSIYPEFYQPSHSVTALGFALLFGPLESTLGWRAALGVALTLISLTWAWGAYRLAQVIHPMRALVGVVAFGAALQWALYMGFFSYVLSAGIGFFTLALAFRHEPWRLGTRVVIGLLLGVQSIYHLFSAQMVLICLSCIVIVRHPVRKWIQEGGLLALMSVPALLLLAYTVGVGTSGPHVPVITEAVVWPSPGDRLRLIGATFVGGPWWRAWPLPVLAAFAIVLGAVRYRKRQLSQNEKALLLACCALFLLSLALPFHLRQWEYLSSRFLPVAVVLAIALLPIERLRNSPYRVLLPVAVASYTGASLTWSAHFHRRLYAACEDLMPNAVSPSPYAGVRLPILLDSLCGEPERWQDADMPFVEPAYNAPFYHAVEYGGIVPYSFTTNPKIHPFVYTANGVEAIVPLPDRGELGRAFRAAQERNNRGKQEEMVLRFGLFGSSKSDIIYYGPAWPRDLLQSRGYVTDYTNGKLWLAQFKGCSGSMEIFPPNLEGIIVEHGWLPFFDFRRKVTVEPEGPRQIAQLAAMACQDAWVRPYLDVDGSGSFSPGDVTCSQSNEAGWIPVPSPQGQVIPCHIVR